MSGGEALNESYPAVPEAVPLARRALAAVAAAAGATGDRLDEIRLAVSEALTNAVVHAYQGGDSGRLHVTAAVASGELWVLIGDDGRGLHAWNDSQGLGIGLSLISGLSDDFSILTRASGGTEVQMRFDLRKTGSEPWVNRGGRCSQRTVRPDLASPR
jgi:anti-sigma regulatory factor (Ser/Thr protein kinase)